MGGAKSSFLIGESPAAMTHRNAPLTPQGRYLLVMRVQAGRPIAHWGALCFSDWRSYSSPEAYSYRASRLQHLYRSEHL